MKTIHRYISGAFISSFLITLVVFTFVMSIGIVFGAAEYISRGIPLRLLLQLVALGLPGVLAYCVSISLLTSSLLVFGRLSADGEITAMKACGIGLWQIVSTPVLVSVLATVGCIYVNTEVVPRNHMANRLLIAQLGMISPTEMLPEAQFTRDFPGLVVWIGRKKGGQLYDIRIHDQREGSVKREIRARQGAVRLEGNGRDIVIDLTDVTISPFDDKRPGRAFVDKWAVKIADAAKTRRSEKREEDYTLAELLDRIGQMPMPDENAEVDDEARERTSLLVELNKRLALSMACFAFVLLGVPLGIKTQRKESSIGIGMSLFVVLCFYTFIVIAKSLERHPSLHPELIVWCPVVLAVLLGLALIRRAD